MYEKHHEGSKFLYLVKIIFLFHLSFINTFNIDIFKPIETPIIQCVHYQLLLSNQLVLHIFSILEEVNVESINSWVV